MKVAKPNRFEIYARFTQIAINDIQRLHIEAFDDEKGQFSSVDGFRFDWSIISGLDKIKKMSVQEVDAKNRGRTDVFLFRAIALGKATVRVRMLEPGYELKEQFIDITVTEPFVVRPSGSVYIMPLCQFKFGLEKLVFSDDGSLEHTLIQIPSANYKWAANSTIGSIRADGVFQSNLTKGTSGILVVDQRMLNNTAEAEIKVVHPYLLEVKLRDVTGQQRSSPLTSDELTEVRSNQTETFATLMFEPASQNELE